MESQKNRKCKVISILESSKNLKMQYLILEMRDIFFSLIYSWYNYRVLNLQTSSQREIAEFNTMMVG